MEGAVKRWIRRQPLECLRRLAVEEDHSATCSRYRPAKILTYGALTNGRRARTGQVPARAPAGCGDPWPRPRRPAAATLDRSSLGPPDRRRTPSCRVRWPAISIPNTRPSRPALIRGGRWEYPPLPPGGIARHQPLVSAYFPSTQPRPDRPPVQAKVAACGLDAVLTGVLHDSPPLLDPEPVPRRDVCAHEPS